MRIKRHLAVFVCLLFSAGFLWAAGQGQEGAKADHPAASSTSSAATPPTSSSATSGIRSEAALRLEGEKRFRANCGRCHQAPHKFPPRMMATIIRHMRVRAMLTDEDMQVILGYLTQ